MTRWTELNEQASKCCDKLNKCDKIGKHNTNLHVYNQEYMMMLFNVVIKQQQQQRLQHLLWRKRKKQIWVTKTPTWWYIHAIWDRWQRAILFIIKRQSEKEKKYFFNIANYSFVNERRSIIRRIWRKIIKKNKWKQLRSLYYVIRTCIICNTKWSWIKMRKGKWRKKMFRVKNSLSHFEVYRSTHTQVNIHCLLCICTLKHQVTEAIRNTKNILCWRWWLAGDESASALRILILKKRKSNIGKKTERKLYL